MHRIIVSSAVLFALAGSGLARTLTVKNNCAYTIWPALYTSPAGGSSAPSTPTGWEATPGTSSSFSVPDNWTAGTVWGRTGCNSSGACVTGGCPGGLVCTGPPNPGPVTLAEFTLGAQPQDYYDVSLVDGFNIPLRITNDAGCPTADCPVDLTTSCPVALQYKSGSAVVGCESDCQVDPNPGDSAACCTGSHNTPATCPASGVPHYSYFKSNCPKAYVYAYDPNGQSPLICAPSTKPNYTVTFCP